MRWIVAVSLVCLGASLHGCSVAEPTVACAGVRCSAGTCVAREGIPECVCGAEDFAAGVRCEILGSGSDETPRDPIQHEAGGLEPEVPRSGVVTAPDAWSFTFPGMAGQAVTLHCATPGPPSGACFIEAYGPEGTVSAQGGGGSNPAQLHYTVRTSGLQRVTVLTREKGATLEFHLTLSMKRGLARTARVLQSGEKVSGSLLYPSDVDAYFVRSPSLGRQIFTLTGGSVTYLITDRTGARFWSDYLPQPLELRVRPGEDLFIAISAPQPEDYELSTLFIGDDHGDSLGESTLLPSNGVPVPGELNYLSDLDVFSFSTPPRHVVRLECGPACEVIAQRQVLYGGPAAADPLYPFMLETGTGWATVRAAAGPYQISLTDLGPDDHPSFYDQGPFQELEATGVVRIQYPQDRDALSKTITASEAYVVEFGGPCSLAVHRFPDGTTPRFLDGAPGTYVAEFSGSALTDCPYTLTSVGPDDFPDTGPFPLLPFPSDLSGALETPADTDRWLIRTPTPRTIKIEGVVSVATCAIGEECIYRSSENEVEVRDGVQLILFSATANVLEPYRIRSVD